MKKIAFMVAIFIAAALLFYSVDRASAQPSWASYSDLGYANPSDEFTVLHCTVYMYGGGFTKNADYKVIYWDGGDNKRIAEVQRAGPDLILESEHTFDVPDVAGNWHCTVYFPDTYDPGFYDPDDSNIVVDDTSYSGYAFYVAESAIPEFPTVMAAIGVAGLCFGIYWWMRRRLGHVKG